MGYARNAVFERAEIENLTVRSPGWAAGFVASEEYDWKAQSIPHVVNNCYVTGLDVKGVLSTGGLFGYLRVHANDAARFKDVYVEDSVIQVMNTSGGKYYDSNSIYAGGIVGAALNNFSLSMTGVSISKTAVLCTSSKQYSGIGNFDAGGFVGRAGTSLDFTDCTLDGSVVFSGTALDNKTAPTDYDALSTANIKDAVYEKIKNAAAYAMNTR